MATLLFEPGADRVPVAVLDSEDWAFDRFIIYPSRFKYASGTAQGVPTIDFQVRVGAGDITDPAFTGVWLPFASNNGFLIQVSGRLWTRIELWARVIPGPVGPINGALRFIVDKANCCHDALQIQTGTNVTAEG